MMKLEGLKPLGVMVLLGVVMLLGYHLYRQQTTDHLAGELRTVREQSTQLRLAELQASEGSRQFAGATDLAAFVESLYACAQRSGVYDHEVATSKQREQSQTRRSRKVRSQESGDTLKVNRLQVTLHGDFRSIAEYLRQLQELERFKQVARFDLQVDKDSLKLLLLLDLYSLKGREES